jgi:hypothetical protein
VNEYWLLPSGVVSSPIFVEPWKNSTRAIEPSVSLADATSVMLAGAVYVEPVTGEMKLTLGGWFGADDTVTFTDDEAVEAPTLSNARAEST